MRRPMDFRALRGLGTAMAVDVGASLAEGLCAVLGLVVAFRAQGESALNLTGSIAYVEWTARVIGVASWAVALVELARLLALSPAFARARAWYLARIIAFAASTIVDSPINFQAEEFVTGSLDPVQSLLAAVSFLLAFVILPALPALAARDVLEGAASVLESCGLVQQAYANRSMAKRFLAASVASVAAFSAAYALLVACEKTSYALAPSGQDAIGLLLAALMGSCVLALALEAVRIVTWARAAARVRKTNDELEVLAS